MSTCLIDGVCFDTSVVEDLVASSAVTGVLVGAAARFGLREAVFMQPFMYSVSAASVVHYVMPKIDNTTRSLSIGIGMGVLCKVLARGADTDCIKYAVVATIANYVSTQYIMPEVNKYISGNQ